MIEAAPLFVGPMEIGFLLLIVLVALLGDRAVDVASSAGEAVGGVQKEKQKIKGEVEEVKGEVEEVQEEVKGEVEEVQEEVQSEVEEVQKEVEEVQKEVEDVDADIGGNSDGPRSPDLGP